MNFVRDKRIILFTVKQDYFANKGEKKNNIQKSHFLSKDWIDNKTRSIIQ